MSMISNHFKTDFDFKSILGKKLRVIFNVYFYSVTGEFWFWIEIITEMVLPNTGEMADSCRLATNALQ